jgi:hypothetical protein
LRQRDAIEMRKFLVAKVVRTAINLRHACAAQEEINVKLPQAERLFDQAVMGGVLPDPLDILEALERPGAA